MLVASLEKYRNVECTSIATLRFGTVCFFSRNFRSAAPTVVPTGATLAPLCCPGGDKSSPISYYWHLVKLEDNARDRLPEGGVSGNHRRAREIL